MRQAWMLVVGLGLVMAGASCSSSDSAPGPAGQTGGSSGSSGTGGGSATGGTTGSGGSGDGGSAQGDGGSGGEGTGGGDVSEGGTGGDEGSGDLDGGSVDGACERLRDCCDHVPEEMDGIPPKAACLGSVGLGSQFLDAGGELTCNAFLNRYKEVGVCH